MKKFLLAALLVVALLLTLVACSDDGNEAATTAAEKATTVAEAATTAAEAKTTAEATTVAEATTATEVATTAEAATTAAEVATTAAEVATTVAEEVTTVEEETEMGDTSKTFASDLASQTVGDTLTASDLSDLFTGEYPTGGGKVNDGYYTIDGISDMFADMDGKYVYTIELAKDMSGSAGNAYVFVRGDYSTVPTGFTADTGAGWYRISNYYETCGDPHDHAGSAGICVNVANGTLTLIVKVIDRERLNYIGHAEYTYAIDSNKITFVDDNEKVDIYAGATLVTSIAISDAKDYDDIKSATGVQFAGTVKFNDAEGNEVVLTDTLVAATAASELGITARASDVSFTSIKVEGLSTAVIPGQPILLLDADFIYDAACNNTNPNNMMAEPGYKFTKLWATGGDPYFTLINSSVTGGQYALIKYRTNAESADAEFFIGTTGGPRGGDEARFTYANEFGVGEWNYVVANLTDSPVYDGSNIGYVRFDFYGDDNANALDVAWIAFFDDAADLAAYAEADAAKVEMIDKDDAEADFIKWSFDTFYVNTDESFYLGSDGSSDTKLAAIDNTVPFAYGEEHSRVAFRGWVGFNQEIAAMGYYVDDTIVYGDFTYGCEDAVLALAGDLATRFTVWADISDCGYGAHKVGCIAKLADGRIVRLYEITVTIAAPTAAEELDTFKHVSNDDIRAKVNDDGTLTLYAWGWVALTSDYDTFGYAIDGLAPVFNAEWVYTAGQDVIDAAASVGGNVATRFKVDTSADISELGYGEHTVKYLCKLADGTIFYFAEKTFEIAEPEVEILPISTTEGCAQSTDGYYENGVEVYYPSAAKWLGGMKDAENNRINGISGVDNATFYGWAGVVGKTIDTFGYIMNGELVTDPDFTVEPSEEEISAMAAEGAGENPKRYSITVDFTTLTEAGIYPITFVVITDDGAIYQIDKWNNCSNVEGFEVKYVKAMAELPEREGTQSETALGAGSQGSPIVNTEPFGYKFTLANGEFLDSVWIYNMATYEATDTVGTFKIYAWDTDYATTKASNPLYTLTITGHANCAPLTVDGFAALNLTNGDYFFELQPSYGSWTPWGAGDGNVGTAVAYVNGEEGTPFIASIKTTTYEMPETIELGAGNQGGAVGTAPFGYMFEVGESQYLKSVTVTHMATYSDPSTVGTFKLYVWDTDVATTTAGEAIYVEEIVNHADNSNLTIDLTSLNLKGNVYYFECQATTGNWTPWAADGDAYGTGYSGGNPASFKASIVVAAYPD